MKSIQLNLFDYRPDIDTDIQECNDSVSWSDGDIAFLREWLLIRSLEVLASATRSDSSQDILDWVNSPVANHPFAFDVCCAVANYHADDIRDSINYMYKRP